MNNEQQPPRRRPGPRPKQSKFITTSISLPRDLKDEVDAAAVEYDISMAELVRLALIEYLANHGKGKSPQ